MMIIFTKLILHKAVEGKIVQALGIHPWQNDVPQSDNKWSTTTTAASESAPSEVLQMN